MSVENRPLQLAPHRLDVDVDGHWTLIRQDGITIRVPDAYQALLRMSRQGASIAALVGWLREQSFPAGRFQFLSRFLMFLDASNLLADRETAGFVEELRPDFAWRESFIFSGPKPFELIRLRSGRSATGLVRILALGAVAAIAVVLLAAVLGRESWIDFANETPLSLFGAFVAVFAIGRSARAMLQAFATRVLTGGSAGLALRLDTISLSLATDDPSRARTNGPSVIASFLCLAGFLLPPVLSGRQAWLAMSCVLLVAELSPFTHSALTECLRSLYVFFDRRRSERHAERDLGALERRVRAVHGTITVLWICALGLLIWYPLREIVSNIRFEVLRVWENPFRTQQDTLALLPYAPTILALFGIVVSFVDDIMAGIGSRDERSIRRLWRRARKRTPVDEAMQHDPNVSPQQFELLPLLRQMDKQVRAALLESADILDLQAGEFVCRQGESDRTLYLILSGSATVGRLSAGRRFKVLARLGPGAVFGEVAFFLGDKRTADVLASDRLRLLAIRHRDGIQDLDRERSGELQLRVRFLQALVSSPLFRHLPGDALDALVFAGKQQVFKAGEKIIREGEAGGDCYFIVQGNASVVQNFAKIRQLTTGDSFGEIALLRPGTLRTATIIADTDLSTVRVDGESFWKLAAAHLPLALELERLAESRLGDDASREAAREA